MVDMTDLSARHTSGANASRLRARRAAELRLKLYGAGAILLAALALVALLWSVVGKAGYALTETYISVDADLSQQALGLGPQASPDEIRKADFMGAVRDGLRAQFPFVSGRSERRDLYALVSGAASYELAQRAADDPALLGGSRKVELLASDDVDLYMKGAFGRPKPVATTGDLTVSGAEGEIELRSTSDDFATLLAAVKETLIDQAAIVRRDAALQENGRRVMQQRAADAETEAERDEALSAAAGYAEQRDVLTRKADDLEARASRAGGEEALDDDQPSILVHVNGGWAKALTVARDRMTAVTLVPLGSADPAPDGEWTLTVNKTPAAGRRIDDFQSALVETLAQEGDVVSRFNWRFFTSGDSREAELAGIWGAAVGSFWTMLVTFCIAFPVGVLAAIYLEEFAPKNRWTDFIEVNINNLAAVPSIVFGLLGLAIFLTGVEFSLFGETFKLGGWVPRSAPLAGGIVLALMTLPTIIIASRAAIRAVPPSIRDAALGLGASKLQTSFHHVLPLAMPGILTGTIIGMAQALGETAPLIMIGMVAFIVDIPHGITDTATVLPVQVFRWSDFPERAFEARTAAAICVLLLFLVIMNALAVFLRKRFERRW